MKYKWLSHKNQSDLILFFNGWGSDENPFLHLDTDGYDVAMFYDYRSLLIAEDLIEELRDYSVVYLISWSFGVWVAQFFCKKYNVQPDYKIAINGTPCPVDDKCGISEMIVRGTLARLNERNLMKFQQRMVGGRMEFENFKDRNSQRDWKEQKEELQALLNHFSTPLQSTFTFNKAIIGMQDLIFIPEKQLNYWREKVKIVKIDAPHYCFLQFKTWNELIK